MEVDFLTNLIVGVIEICNFIRKSEIYQRKTKQNLATIEQIVTSQCTHTEDRNSGLVNFNYFLQRIKLTWIIVKSEHLKNSGDSWLYFF